MIDSNARQALQNRQTAKAISDGIEKLAGVLKETSVVAPKQQSKTPAADVADELRNLQKMIGGGNLTESLSKLSQSLDGFDVDSNALGQLKSLVANLSARLKLLAEIEAKLPKEVKLNFPKEFPVTGTVDVGSVDSLPPIHVTNLDEVGKTVGMLIANLQTATIKAIERSKTEFPKQVQVGNEVKIAEFSDLLDGIEELKEGFNILINKEAATVGFPDKSIPVEIQNWMIPQPVTNININPLKGVAKTTAVTVTTSQTVLPPSALTNRRTLIFYNNSTVTVYIGGSSVTVADGLPVPSSTFSPPIDAGPNMGIYGIISDGTAEVRVMEVSNDNSGGG